MPRHQRRHGRRAVPLLVGTLAAALLAGCTVSPATEEAQRVQGLYNLFLVSAAVVFVIVAGLIGWNILRYRAKPGDTGLPTQTSSNIALELTWWALPTLLVIVLFAISAVVLNTNDAQTADPGLRVKVEGFQWQWRFTYTDAGVVVTGTRAQKPELVLPVGEVVDFQLVSDDVIHSFFIPHFLVKRDLIPGVDNHLQLTIDEAGTYSGQCAEFCGLYHDEMRFTIRAVSQADFTAWLAAQPRSAP
jgi:cytochrome c oxidase subunit II